MLIDPSGRRVPYTPPMKGPDQFVPVEGHPGTFPSGTGGDNYPLEEYVGIADKVGHQELEIDAVSPEIFPPAEDLLEFLDSINKLVARSDEDDELDEDVKRQMTGITEEDLEYGDSDEEEVLTYFTRSGLDSSRMSPSSGDGYSYDDMY